MADRILVSTEELNAGIDNYHRAQKEVVDSLNGMRKAAHALDGDWQGSASGEFLSAFDGLYASIMRTEDLMEEAVQELQAFSSMAQEAEGAGKNLGSQTQSMSDSL